jgi:hypothetical protein
MCYVGTRDKKGAFDLMHCNGNLLTVTCKLLSIEGKDACTTNKERQKTLTRAI